MAIPPFVAGVALTAAQLNAGFVWAIGGVLLSDSAQTITNNTVTDVTWGTEASDPDGWTSGGSATLTVPTGKGGRYIVSYVGLWSASPGAGAGISGFFNGVGAYDTGGISAFATFSHTLTYVRTFVAGDTLKFQCYQNSGSNKDLTSRLEICPA